MRRETEWTETVDAGWNVLSGPSAVEMQAAKRALDALPSWKPIYGDGFAANRIAHCIAQFIGRQ